MHYLFFTNTPAHVHLYRNAVAELLDRGDEVTILAREDECSTALLDWYDLPYRLYGRLGSGKRSLVRRLPVWAARIVREARRVDPDLVFGIGPYAALAGAVTRTPTVLVTDSEPTLDGTLSRPFVTAILTPEAYRRHLGPKHFVFRGFKESAYLHPAVFRPQVDVHEALGLDADEPFAIVRFNSFAGHHDFGKRGFTRAQRRTLLETLAESVTTFVSDEAGRMDLDDLPARRYDLHPALIHDALAGAELLVADTQTMVTEAALLGTPAVRSNSFVGADDMGNFLSLEAAGLVENVRAFDEVLDAVTTLLADDDRAETWARRRDAFVADTVDLTQLLLQVAADHEHLDRLPSLSRPTDPERRVPSNTGQFRPEP